MQDNLPATTSTIIVQPRTKPDQQDADPVLAYIKVLIWPFAILLVAWWLKERLTELEGFGAKARFGKKVNASEASVEEFKEN